MELNQWVCYIESERMAYSIEEAATSRYVNSVNESFPNPDRYYKIDGSIKNRIIRDYLPVNSNLDSSNIQDGYVEFILNASDTEFVNLDNLFLELKLKFKNEDGDDIDDETNFSVIDCLGISIISRCSVFLNSVPCESNSFKGLYEYVKIITSTGYEESKNLGKLNFMKSLYTDIVDTVTENTYSDESVKTHEKQIMKRAKESVHTFAPLKLDISSADFYLLDHVEIRIRLDLQPASYIALSNGRLSYDVVCAKLHVEKINPNTSALISLNNRLINYGSNIDYIFDRPIIKTSILAIGQSSLVLDDIVNGFIPSKMYVFFVAQSALKGTFNRNPLYLSDVKANSIRVDVNGNVFSHCKGSFPDSAAQFLVNTLRNNGSKDSLITYENFSKGRCVHVYDFNPSLSSDCLTLDRRGSVRLAIDLDEGLSENYVLFCISILNASLSINASRKVETSFLM